MTVSITPGGRLTLVSGSPWTGSSGATTLYYTPAIHNIAQMYDGSVWARQTFNELSIAIPATTNTNYDVFLQNDAGMALEFLVWTDDTTRATALARQNGVLVKSGDATRLFLGTIRTTGVSGQSRVGDGLYHFVANYYNTIWSAIRTRASVTHAYTAGWRPWNNNTGKRVFGLICHEDHRMHWARVFGNCYGPNQGAGNHGVGTDSTTSGWPVAVQDDSSNTQSIVVSLTGTVGYHFWQLTQYGAAGVNFYTAGLDITLLG